MKNLDPGRAKWIRLRMGILCGTMGLGLGGIVSTAYRVQVEDGPIWRETAEKQRQRRLHIEPKRGTIYDRNGTSLAVSVEVPSVSIDTAEILRNVDGAANQQAALDGAAVRIAKALHLDAHEVAKRLSTHPRFAWMKRRVSSDEAQAIRDLGDSKKQLGKPVKGLTIEGEGHRYYPGRELLGTVLGFVAPDGHGKDGLELALDEELRGHAEEIKGLRDRSGRLIFSEGVTDEGALQGKDISLTIDEGIQHVAQREIDAAQQTYETKGGAVVVVDPNTGEILALASTPGYNPNDYGESEVEARRNHAIHDRFEPGSVMKMFTLAAAFAAGTLKPNEAIYCEKGSYVVGNATIHDTHPAEWLTPTQIIAKSSNIGALKVGLGLGEQGLYSALKKFGFGEPTGLPLPGEVGGVLRSRGRPWVEVETANASFGQGISVSAMQLAMAVSVIANGGRLLEPVLVRKVTDGRGRVVRESSPRVRREVLPPGIARLMSEMLVAVTEPGGTGVEAAVPGFRVAGKTSTAQKVDPATGKYSLEKFTASFAGFVPADRPRLVVAVVLDEPLIGHTGGDLAGPVFRRVAQASLRYLGVAPSGANPRIGSASRQNDVADVAMAALKPKEPEVPEVPAPLMTAAMAADAARVPDVNGLPAREALRILGAAGFSVQMEGSGRVVKQQPAAGAAHAKGAPVRLVFDSPS